MTKRAPTPTPADPAVEHAPRRYPQGFTLIDNRILNDFCPQIGMAGLALYVMLGRYADNVTRQCYPSTRTLSRRLGSSQPTVLKHLQVLEAAGLVEVVRARSSRGQRHVNVYTLLPVPAGQAALPSLGNDVAHMEQDGKATLPSKGNDVGHTKQDTKAPVPPLLNDVEHPAKRALAELYSINNTQLNKRECVGRVDNPSYTPPTPSSHLDHFAVKAYREVCGLAPDVTQRAAIAAAVTDRPRWTEVIRQ